MKSKELLKRVGSSYEKYGWTEEQRKVFDRFIDKRCVLHLFEIVEGFEKPICTM
jgi:hypothetical protein